MELWHNIYWNWIELLADLAPYLSLIILMRKLNSDKLSKHLGGWIVNNYDRLILVCMLADWTVKNCIILCPDTVF